MRMRPARCLAVAFLFAVFLTTPVDAASVFTTPTSGSLDIRDAWDSGMTGPPTTASPYSWDLAVDGLSGVISNMTVKLYDYWHQNPPDVDALLMSPTGVAIILMSDAGLTYANHVNITFSDDAAFGLSTSSDPVNNGVYKPTNFGTSADVFPAPAPTLPVGGYGTSLSDFDGTNPNGTWKLFIVDDAGGDRGGIWRYELSIDTEEASIPEPGSGILLAIGVGVVAALRRRVSTR